MKRRFSGIALIATLTLFGFPPWAGAQYIPAGEVTGGFQIHSPWWSGFFDRARPFSGWSASAARNVNDRASVVFEVGRTEYGFTYTRIDHLLRLVDGSAEYARTDQVAVRASDRVYTGGIGVRYRRGSGRLRPFVQFLAGLASTKRVENPPTPLPLGCDDTCRQLPTQSQQMLIVQPGVGLDIQLADRFALRVQGDLQGFLVEEFTPRVSASLVLGLGSRH